jgi:O-antigen/teichoic acid export membrane protein
MKQKSLKINYILNTSRILLGMVFPLITWPYVSRVLMTDNIGKVAYANSIITYFLLFSSIGIPLYGIRECSKVRDDRQKLSKLAHELFIINIITSALSYIIFFSMIILSGKLSQNYGAFESFYNNKELLTLMSITIIFTTIGFEWLYQALEEYFYITMRSLAFQILSIILLFALIKSKDDYMVYAALSVFASVGANIMNLVHSRKFIDFKVFKNYEFKKHLKPIITMSAMTIAASIYTNLDTIMLESFSGDSATGLFNAATKVNRILVVFVTSIGSVMIPRISYYMQEKRDNEAGTLISKSLDFIFMMSLPVSIGLFMLSYDINILFSGQAFAEAGNAMRIISPIIILVGISNLIGLQLMVPAGKEKYTLYSIIGGAVVNFTLNLILIPLYAQNGAAVSTLAAEGTVTLIQIIFSWNIIKKYLFTKSKLHYLIAALLIVIEVSFIKTLYINRIYILVLSVTISTVTYFSVLIILKNKLALEIKSKILRRDFR